MYNPLTTFLQQVGLYAVEIGYKTTHPRCWERNLKKAASNYTEENEDFEMESFPEEDSAEEDVMDKALEGKMITEKEREDFRGGIMKPENQRTGPLSKQKGRKSSFPWKSIVRIEV